MREPGPKPRILVVDDIPQNRRVAERFLTAAGYAITEAENGEQALAAVVEAPPDVVLLDILMPGMDGIEACRRLRGLPGGAELPVLFLTAAAEVDWYDKAVAAGADDFLTKPIQRTELLLRVRSLARLRRLQRQKQELTDLIVHDLKNPVAAILGNQAYLRGSERLAEEERECVEDTHDAAETMRRLVLNLLDVSRSEDGVLVPRLAEADVLSVLEKVVQSFAHRARVEDRTLALDAGTLVAEVDADLLERLVANLLDNALKYSPRGGAVRVEARLVGQDLEVRVRDEGAGIPPAYRDRIFEKYVQLDRDARTHARSSRGLGLLFCRLAAEAHGGTIRVEDNEPRGSCFVVRVPKAARGDR